MQNSIELFRNFIYMQTRSRSVFKVQSVIRTLAWEENLDKRRVYVTATVKRIYTNTASTPFSLLLLSHRKNLN